jgi:hypothetical protein
MQLWWPDSNARIRSLHEPQLVPNAHKLAVMPYFYDEDVTDLPRLVSAVYVGMKAMEIG